MKISTWLLNYYKEKFGDDIVVLDHSTGPTWNDGGSWNNTIVKRGKEAFQIYMPSDYNTDDLRITKVAEIMKVIYTPIE